MEYNHQIEETRGEAAQARLKRGLCSPRFFDLGWKFNARKLRNAHLNSSETNQFEPASLRRFCCRALPRTNEPASLLAPPLRGGSREVHHADQRELSTEVDFQALRRHGGVQMKLAA